MGRYVMVVQSAAHEGRESDYNEWYDNIHLPAIRSVPGVLSGRRFEATPVAIGTPGQAYLSIFEIETEDFATFMAEMNRRSTAGSMRETDSLDPSSVALWIYKQREEVEDDKYSFEESVTYKTFTRTIRHQCYI